MAFPSSIDTFGTPAGTSTLANPDHASEHRTLGSAVGSIENVLGTTLGTGVLSAFQAGDLAPRINVNGVLQTQLQGTLTASDFLNGTIGTPSIQGGTIQNSFIGTIRAQNGSVLAEFNEYDTTAENYFYFESRPAGTTILSSPLFEVVGTQANIGLQIKPKGSGTVQITNLNASTATFGTPAITGGTANNQVIGTPSITGGTSASQVINNATIGTPAITGGTANSQVLGTPTIDHFTSSGTTVPSVSDRSLAPTVGSLTDAAAGTITPNAPTGNVFSLTLGTTAGNRTLAAPLNATDGQSLTFRIKQNAGATGTIVWNAIYRFDSTTGTATLGTASTWNYYGFRYNSIDSKWDYQGANKNII